MTEMIIRSGSTGAAVLAAALVLTGCLAACSSPAAPTPASPSSPPTAADDASELTITVDDGQGSTTTWQLTCKPAAGTHPSPEAACDELVQNAATALPAVPQDKFCADVYGGPHTATIVGVWKGNNVNSRFSRVNACESARWESLRTVHGG